MATLSPAATAQSIPSFFIDFHRHLCQLVHAYSAELSRWGAGMTLDGLQRRNFTDAPSAMTKVRPPQRRTQNGRDLPLDRTGGRHSGLCKVRIIRLNRKVQIDEERQKRNSPLKSKENVQEIQEQQSINVSPDFGQPKSSSRRRATGHPPQSIRDRLRRTLAPRHLAVAANEQMPLETLEQTVAETLPESITESGNYSDFLRQYLEDFERDLLNDDTLTNCGSGADQVDKRQTADSLTYSQHIQMHNDDQTNGSTSRDGVQGRGPKMHGQECTNSFGFDARDFVVPQHAHTLFNRDPTLPCRQRGAVQPCPSPTIAAIDSISATTTSSSSDCLTPIFRWKVLKRKNSPQNESRLGKIGQQRAITSRTEERVVIDSEEDEPPATSAISARGGEEERHASTPEYTRTSLFVSTSFLTHSPNSKKFCPENSICAGGDSLAVASGSHHQQSLAHLQPSEQYGGHSTPQKFVDGTLPSPVGLLSSSLSAVNSPYSSSIPTVKVLERGRVIFKTPSPSQQKTPTESSTNTTSTPLMATPKLLATRRIYCNKLSTRRPRRIAPQKEGVNNREQTTKRDDDDAEEADEHGRTRDKDEEMDDNGRIEDERGNREDDEGMDTDGKEELGKRRRTREWDDGMDDSGRSEDEHGERMRDQDDGIDPGGRMEDEHGKRRGDEMVGVYPSGMMKGEECKRIPGDRPILSERSMKKQLFTGENSVNGYDTSYGIMTFPELNEELIGRVLNTIHSRDPDQ